MIYASDDKGSGVFFYGLEEEWRESNGVMKLIKAERETVKRE